MRHLPILLLLLLLPATALAQTPDEVARAEDHYRAGMTAFQSGDFATAATEFQLSYDLVPKPELLYNASFALARNGDIDAARDIALDAVATRLPQDIDAKFRARLHGWRVVERAQNPPPAATPVASTTPPREEVVVVEQPAPRSGNGLRVASYITGAVGVSALLTAGVMELQLAGVERDLDDAAGRDDANAYDAALQRGHRLQNFGRVAIITGASLVVTSVVLWVIAPKKRREAGPQVVLRF